MKDSKDMFKGFLGRVADNDFKEIESAPTEDFKDGQKIFKFMCQNINCLLLAVGYSNGIEFLTVCENPEVLKRITELRKALLLVAAQVESKFHDRLEKDPLSYLRFVPVIGRNDVEACRRKATSYKISGLWELINRDWLLVYEKTRLMSNDIYASYSWIDEFANRLRLYLMTVESEIMARKEEYGSR